MQFRYNYTTSTEDTLISDVTEENKLIIFQYQVTE